MKPFKSVFFIVEEKNCPLYEVGEKLVLSEKTLSCPEGKETCLILVRDMTQLLFQLLGEKEGAGIDTGRKYNCTGCTGLIKFSRQEAGSTIESPATGGSVPAADWIGRGIKEKIGGTPFLRSLPAGQADRILSQFSRTFFEEGVVLIQKGEQNLNLYLVVEGELLVEDDTILLATLAAGDLCGEMSCLGADIAVATVRAAKKTEVLVIEGKKFDSLLGTNGSVQAFLAQLMAVRLREINVARARDFESCMSGRLDEIVPAELFQIFHMHQKTGVLAMDLPRGKGKVSFREGCLINASYAGEKSQDAIFKILVEKKGVYRFTTGLSPKEMKAAEIGDFMMLLMEGVRRVDDEQEG
ncbi:MAG: DUF4388 domain-containing protein [Deltaproteobacteria bacterium]|nr:DUF4388 domain-containing protein [Deltaproteobacteria bacterium]